MWGLYHIRTSLMYPIPLKKLVGTLNLRGVEDRIHISPLIDSPGIGGDFPNRGHNNPLVIIDLAIHQNMGHNIRSPPWHKGPPSYRGRGFPNQIWGRDHKNGGSD